MAGYMETAKNSDWETPQKLYDRLNEVFKFNIDVAASDNNAKCNFHLSEKDNALNSRWNVSSQITGEYKDNCFCNPPYNDVLSWVKRAFYQVCDKHCDLAVLLIPSSTELTAWHKYIWSYARYIIFLKGRVYFERNGEKVGASPKGSAIVVFSREDIPGIDNLSDLGKIVKLS